MGFVAPMGQPMPKYLGIVFPFDMFVWSLIILILVTMPVVLYISANIEKKISNVNSDYWIKYNKSAWYCFGTLVGESLTNDTKCADTRAMRYSIFS